MASDKPDALLIGPPKPIIVDGLTPAFTLHQIDTADDQPDLVAKVAPRVRAIAVSVVTEAVPGAFMAKLPKLQIVSTFGVGYSHIDAAWAGAHGVTVTNTPEVLTEEVADTALGLLLCTVRELPQADRFVRAGSWDNGEFPLSPTLRDRTVGLLGMGAIGQAIARRLDAFQVPVVYHTRTPRPDLPYRHYPDLTAMARDVDVLLAIVPGGAATRHLVNAGVLAALGSNGIFINVARGSVVDQAALITALQNRTILAAGLDVFEDEPHVPSQLRSLHNVVLFPHLGSATVATRNKMDQLVVDNLLAWTAGEPPLTPVPEAPWRKGGAS
jgi:lactate dehydrogenase-like 2-hydroxyacid dehydrogenase